MRGLGNHAGIVFAMLGCGMDAPYLFSGGRKIYRKKKHSKSPMSGGKSRMTANETGEGFIFAGT